METEEEAKANGAQLAGGPVATPKKLLWSDAASYKSVIRPESKSDLTALSLMTSVSELLIGQVNKNHATLAAEAAATAAKDSQLHFGYISVRVSGREASRTASRFAVFFDVPFRVEGGPPPKAEDPPLIVSIPAALYSQVKSSGKPVIQYNRLTLVNSCAALQAIPHHVVPSFPKLYGRVVIHNDIPHFQPSERTSMNGGYRKHNSLQKIPISCAIGQVNPSMSLVRSLPKHCAISCQLGLHPSLSSPMVWNVERISPLDHRGCLRGTETPLTPIVVNTPNPAPDTPPLTVPFAEGHHELRPSDRFSQDVWHILLESSTTSRSAEEGPLKVHIRQSPAISTHYDSFITTADIDLYLLGKKHLDPRWDALNLDELVEIFLSVKTSQGYEGASFIKHYLTDPNMRVNVVFDLAEDTSSSQAYWLIQKSFLRKPSGHRYVDLTILPWSISPPRTSFPIVAAIPGPAKSKAVCPALDSIHLRDEGYQVNLSCSASSRTSPATSPSTEAAPAITKNLKVALLVFSEHAKLAPSTTFKKIQSDPVIGLSHSDGSSTVVCAYDLDVHQRVPAIIEKLVRTKKIAYKRMEQSYSTDKKLMHDIYHVLHVTPITLSVSAVSALLRRHTPWVMPISELGKKSVFVASTKTPLPVEADTVASLVSYSIILDKHTYAFALSPSQSQEDVATLLKLKRPSEAFSGPLARLLPNPGNPWAEVADLNARYLVGYTGPDTTRTIDPFTIYISNLTDLYDACGTLNILSSALAIGNDRLSLTLAPDPEHTKTRPNSVFCRYLRTASGQAGPRSADPLVLAVTSHHEATLSRLQDGLKCIEANTNHLLTQKLHGLYLLEHFSSVLPPSHLDDSWEEEVLEPSSLPPTQTRQSWSSIFDDDLDSFDDPTQDSNATGTHPSGTRNKYSSFLEETTTSSSVTRDPPRQSPRTPAARGPKVCIITNWLQAKFASKNKLWTAITKPNKTEMTQLALKVVQAAYPLAQDAKTVGSHAKQGGLLKAIDTGVQGKKSITAIINILKRAATNQNPVDGYKTAVDELTSHASKTPSNSRLPSIPEKDDEEPFISGWSTFPDPASTSPSLFSAKRKVATPASTSIVVSSGSGAASAPTLSAPQQIEHKESPVKMPREKKSRTLGRLPRGPLDDFISSSPNQQHVLLGLTPPDATALPHSALTDGREDAEQTTSSLTENDHLMSTGDDPASAPH
jgi:hypothetical protein